MAKTPEDAIRNLVKVGDLHPQEPPELQKLFLDPHGAQRTPLERAQLFFASDPSQREKHSLLEFLETALEAYVDVREAKILGEVRAVNLKIAKAKSHADRAEKVARQVENQLPKMLHDVADLEAKVSAPAAALEGFKASITESLKLQEARKLWKETARNAKRAYIGSWITLTALLVVVPAIAIWQSDAIFAFFRAIGEAVLVDLPANASETAIFIAAVSRLVLVTLPIVLYIWLIRIVVRFNMRSLLLMDDANQRNTMLETYLHLVEQDADVKSDRPLILEALFRRTPGHGPEAIEPPNLADILRISTPTTIK